MGCTRRVLRVRLLHHELPDRRVVDEETAQRVVVIHLHHLTSVRIRQPGSLPAAAPVQRQPATAGLHPLPQHRVLLLCCHRTGYVRDQQLALRQPLLDVLVVTGHRRVNVIALLQLL